MIKSLLVAIAASCIIFACANAQAQQPSTSYNIKVDNSQLDLIGKALGKMPYEDVAVLMQVLRQQVVEQSKLPEIKTPEAKAPDTAKKAE